VFSRCSCKTPQNQQKEKRGRESTIVLVFFHILTIVGESLQKISKNGETFSWFTKNDKSNQQKTKVGES
jgi:hypothetical protein